jgi:arylsulfatase A-like enzyme
VPVNIENQSMKNIFHSRYEIGHFVTVMASLCALAIFPSCNLANENDTPKPNIVLCMTDDQGWGDVGYNGHPVLRTPHLDEMAREGIRFERFYSGAPVCSPTRGSCLTGRHPYRYGITFANTGHIKKEEITLAELLRSLDYSTGFFGKWHLGTLTTQMKDSNRGRPGDASNYSPPWENGFDVTFATEAKVPTYWKDSVYLSYGTHYWTGPGQMVPADQVKGDDSKLIMDRALDFIGSAAKENSPFLAVIWFHTPHLPVVSAPPYTDGYTENTDYYGCISAMDEQMGRLRATLKTSGVEENTIVWFCSDNGPEGDSSFPGWTQGLRGRKRSLYEGGVRVPGLMVWPKMFKEGRVVNMPCSTSDYFPTILDILDFPLDSTKVLPHDGISLLPLIKGQEKQRERPIAFESKSQLSLTDNRYKIYSKNSGESYELYDLITDQGEEKNIANLHPEMVESMVKTLEQWRRSCNESALGKDY